MIFLQKKNLQNINIKIINKPSNIEKYKDINSKNKIYENSREVIETKNNEKIYPEIIPFTSEDKLDNFELNNLDYLMALKFDNRKFLEIYWSILRREHSILFTFFNRNDHNIIYIKYSRFIFFICTDMALNVFFFFR